MNINFKLIVIDNSHTINHNNLLIMQKSRKFFLIHNGITSKTTAPLLKKLRQNFDIISTATLRRR